MTDNDVASLERSLGRIEGELVGIKGDVSDTKQKLDTLSTSGFAWCKEHKEAIDKLVESAKKNNNGHSAKLKLGPLSISGVSATVVTRLSLIAGICYLIAKANKWVP